MEIMSLTKGMLIMPSDTEYGSDPSGTSQDQYSRDAYETSQGQQSGDAYGTSQDQYGTNVGGAEAAMFGSTGPGFGKHFSDCMGNLGLPVPNSLFSTLAAATATIKAIQAAVATYGT